MVFWVQLLKTALCLQRRVATLVLFHLAEVAEIPESTLILWGWTYVSAKVWMSVQELLVTVLHWRTEYQSGTFESVLENRSAPKAECAPSLCCVRQSCREDASRTTRRRIGVQSERIAHGSSAQRVHGALSRMDIRKKSAITMLLWAPDEWAYDKESAPELGGCAGPSRTERV